MLSLQTLSLSLVHVRAVVLTTRKIPSDPRYKAVTRNLFRSGLFSFVPLLFPLFSRFFSLSSASKWPLNPVKGFGVVLFNGENEIFSY